MKVKAVFAGGKEFGFYDNKRCYNGDVFTLTDKSHFSKNWMEWIDPPVEEKPKRGRPKKVEEDLEPISQFPEPE